MKSRTNLHAIARGRFRIGLAAVPGALVALLAGIPALLAQPAVLILKSGTVHKGELVRVTDGFTELRIASGGVSSISFNHENVERVDFPATPAWKHAIALYDQGDHGKAAVALEEIARDRSPRTYHPAPGNFSTLADRRLIDCYRRTLDPKKLASVARRIEWDRLPPEERGVRPLSELWALAGEAKWSEAEREATQFREKLPPGDDLAGEVSYLEGLALEGQGRIPEALLAYGRAIGLYPGAARHLAGDAVRRSVQLLDGIGTRQRERDALLVVYAKCFGDGTLWEGALPDWQMALETALRERSGGNAP